MTHASQPAPGPQSAGAPSAAPPAYGALVLAGGAARRLDGRDKPAVTVGGRPLLDRVLTACADAAQTVVVGPRRPTPRPVEWARESPPGSGPLAGLHAGLLLLSQETVLVLGADLPFLDRETVRALLRIPDGCEGSLVHDGRDQPLTAAYRTEPLRREIALLYTEYGTLSGLPLRLLPAQLRLHRVTSPASSAAAHDCDTWEDVATARARVREHGTVLDEWITAVEAELGIESGADKAALLDLARDAAHGVARPAAPLTTFLVGYAAGRAGGSPEEIARATAKAADLARRWAEESAPGGTEGGAGEQPPQPGSTASPRTARDPDTEDER